MWSVVLSKVSRATTGWLSTLMTAPRIRACVIQATCQASVGCPLAFLPERSHVCESERKNIKSAGLLKKDKMSLIMTNKSLICTG